MRLIVCALFAVMPVLAAPAHAGTVVATVKPLHSLAAGVMEGDGNTLLLLVDGTSSLHTFHLRPSQVQALQRADAVFYISGDFELFMDKVLGSLPEAVRRAPMEKISGMTLYPVRYLDAHEATNIDLHLWLSPANAKAMATEIARRLTEIYPAQAALYETNRKKILTRIDALDAGLQARLNTLRGRPFFVFHDAYQYFERYYGLYAAGAVTLHPERPPGAKRMQDIREKIRAAGAACVFREPSFDMRAVDNLLEGLSVRNAALDPEGALLDPGPELYFQLMENLAAGLEQCLR